MNRLVLASLFAWAAIALSTSLVFSQETKPQEGKLGADLRLEGDDLAQKCNDFAAKKLVDCATTLITDHPFHLAIGSLAPQNGFGFGLAFVAPQSKPNDDWRINWSADVVGTPSAAWRAGVYARFVNSRVPGIGVVGPGAGTSSGSALPRPYPTFALYAQTTNLPSVSYFGLGNETSVADRTSFAMRESTIGGGAFWPIARSGLFNRLNPVALFDLNGRWVHVAGSTSGNDPSIDTRFTDLTAPRLDTQPATLQVSEGVRIAPSIGRIQLTYSGICSNTSRRRRPPHHFADGRSISATICCCGRRVARVARGIRTVPTSARHRSIVRLASTAVPIRPSSRQTASAAWVFAWSPLPPRSQMVAGCRSISNEPSAVPISMASGYWRAIRTIAFALPIS